MKKLYKIFHYFTLLKLRKGFDISYTLTWKCNLVCPYCASKQPLGSFPDAKEVSMFDILDNLRQWERINHHKARQIQLTGGSPELYHGFVPLVNTLLDMGYLVHVNSNLTYYGTLRKIKPSRRFLIVSTFHHSANPAMFELNYLMLSKKYQIKVDEINDKGYESSWHPLVDKAKMFDFSTLKELTTDEYLKEHTTLIHVNPDLSKIALNCWDACL